MFLIFKRTPLVSKTVIDFLVSTGTITGFTQNLEAIFNPSKVCFDKKNRCFYEWFSYGKDGKLKSYTRWYQDGNISEATEYSKTDLIMVE